MPFELPCLLPCVIHPLFLPPINFLPADFFAYFNPNGCSTIEKERRKE
jgi:hypothetical protein